MDINNGEQILQRNIDSLSSCVEKNQRERIFLHMVYRIEWAYKQMEWSGPKHVMLDDFPFSSLKPAKNMIHQFLRHDLSSTKYLSFHRKYFLLNCNSFDIFF